jgi:inosine-uridine nucleoside N-ribohydrolase
MARKVVLLADPGIDTAFALALALYDPQLNVLTVGATAGMVAADKATANVHALVEHFNPDRLPRLGAALPVNYGVDNSHLFGPAGLGGVTLASSTLHHPHPTDKLIVEEARQHRGEVTVITLGPLTALARAFDRDPELPRLLKSLVVVGGTWHTPGDAGPVSEFNFSCDPAAARQVVRSGVPLTLLPLDVTCQALFAPAELDQLLEGRSAGCALLRKMVPFGVHATAQACGIEGIMLRDVLGVAAVALPTAIRAKPATVDVETQGEITRGMMVVDQRPRRGDPNLDVAYEVDLAAVRDYMWKVLRAACA